MLQTEQVVRQAAGFLVISIACSPHPISSSVFFLMFPRSRLAFPSSTPSKISDPYTTVRAWELKSNALDLVHWETKSISSVDWVAVAKCLHG